MHQGAQVHVHSRTFALGRCFRRSDSLGSWAQSCQHSDTGRKKEKKEKKLIWEETLDELDGF